MAFSFFMWRLIPVFLLRIPRYPQLFGGHPVRLFLQFLCSGQTDLGTALRLVLVALSNGNGRKTAAQVTGIV